MLKKVDPKLFVTCRLCLDVQGQFQIDPTVQQQIQYCFDIEVEPFDGLPQLICKQCEVILKNHFAIKKKFKDKQKDLKAKLEQNVRNAEKSPSPQQEDLDNCINEPRLRQSTSTSRLDDSDSCNHKDEHDEKPKSKRKKVKKKRIARLSSSSGDDLECNETQIETNAQIHNEDFIPWDENFNKYSVCRICSQGFKNKKDIKKHLKSHSMLHMKYKNVFKTSCLVVMEKVDRKPNLCNNNKAVVYSPDTVLQNSHNPFYYTKYHPKTYSDITNSFKYMSKNYSSNAESSADEVRRRKRRRLRSRSRSSSETVVLNRHSEVEDTPHTAEDSKTPPKIIEYIDVIDSSDNESCEKTSNSNIKENQDSKPMQDIIKICFNKYVKQNDSRQKAEVKENDKKNEDLLQRKVLSIGRKVINNKGFNCTGLLRFLECKDLSVIWKETSVLKANNDGKYARIAIRVRENESGNVNNVGWKNYNLIKCEQEQNVKSVNILKKLKMFENFKKKKEIKPVTNDEENENLPRISSVFNHNNLEISKIDCDNLMLQKLLNENPVSNPKQLPKKASSNDSTLKGLKVFSAPNTIPIVNVEPVKEINETHTNSMPIVTSTVSLAHLYEKDKNIPPEDPVVTPTTQKTIYPRIKVKPVSELMPEKSTSNINSNGVQNASQMSTMTWPTPNTSNDNRQHCSGQAIAAVIGNPKMWPKQNNSYNEQPVWPNHNIPLNEQNNVTPNKKVSKPSINTEADVMALEEYMLLDTVEFPNTETNSPYQYFKNLLLVHDITLQDANQPLPAGSDTLIRLKLLYQQENCEPITLWSSLFCYKNIFSIHIKNLNLTNVDINNLAANWQMQVLRMFTDEVINKVLQTAIRISQETFKYTQQFFALLKSIKIKNK